jgi:Flp pilus assembly pilin Flp
MRMRSFRRILKGKKGQTAIEYLLTTLTLVTVFAGMYGFLQGQLRNLFILAGTKILTPYY